MCVCVQAQTKTVSHVPLFYFFLVFFLLNVNMGKNHMRRLQQSAATSTTLLNLFLWDTDDCKGKIEEYHNKSYGKSIMY